MTGGFFDFDDDGDFDLFQVNDRGAYIVPNRLFRNDADGPGEPPVFEDTTAREGFTSDPDGMGLAIGDFDLDGRADLFTTGSFEVLWLRTNSRYVDSTLATGFTPPAPGRLSWGGVAADFDADGDEDIWYVDSMFFDDGFDDTDPYRGPAFYYRNDLSHESRFVRRPLEGAPGELEHWRGNAGVDFDGDGVPDLYNATVERAPTMIFTNPGPSARGVEVRLHGVSSNTEGRGAIVRATVADRVMTRWPGGSDPFSCGIPTWMFFGLGRDDAIERLEITWPSGIVQQVLDIPAGTRLHVREPE
jgi:hypothetical protein